MDLEHRDDVLSYGRLGDLDGGSPDVDRAATCISSACSTTVTSKPALASQYAAVAPAMPAPEINALRMKSSLIASSAKVQ